MLKQRAVDHLGGFNSSARRKLGAQVGLAQELEGSLSDDKARAHRYGYACTLRSLLESRL
ncbi:hypothetical protein BDW72DRAFT_167472 [Aspergillus terricola var. indicus]